MNMRAVDIIEKKKAGKSHTKQEIEFFIKSYMEGGVEDYQMSAWLMAVCLNGLNFNETACLTECFVKSGDVLDFSKLGVHIADKHSTGGVGDKVTLVLIPILASLGVHCAKLSGRGLGMTGGTIDKLESIKRFNCALDEETFKRQVKEIGAAISSQTPNLVPADGRIYALRDVTGTVDNMSLICASVVSKKIASGADIIVLDVKYGSGAFIKTFDDAKRLADLMIKVGAKLGRKIDAVISSMEQPLGKTVGNSLEAIEAIEFLKGKMSFDLYEITLALAAKTLIMAGIATNFKHAKMLFDNAILSGHALSKFKQIIAFQGGNSEIINHYSLFKTGENFVQVRAKKDEGYVQKVDALEIAKACKLLGAGRDKKTDNIDFGAGCVLTKKTGYSVKKGDVLITLYFNNVEESKVKEAVSHVLSAYKFGSKKPRRMNVVRG